MALIINIETSTKACSVALSNKGVLIDYVLHISEEFKHAEVLHTSIQTLLNKNGLEVKGLDAIAVSQGPGSYTGLRIGVSAAKGLAYAANLPLIAQDTLQLLAFQARLELPDQKYFVAMIDARRMEVFTAMYDQAMNTMIDPHALILDENSFAEEAEKTIVFCGDGAEKCKPINFIPKIIYADVIHPQAQHMCALSYEKFIRNEFENVAYFEPFYLKEFQIKTKS